MLACPELFSTEPCLMPQPERAAWHPGPPFRVAQCRQEAPSRRGPLQRHCVIFGNACLRVGLAGVLGHLVQGCAAVLPLSLLVSEQVGEQDCRPGLLVGNGSLALLGLVAEQGHAVPGSVGGDVAEGVAGET